MVKFYLYSLDLYNKFSWKNLIHHKVDETHNPKERLFEKKKGKIYSN